MLEPKIEDLLRFVYKTNDASDLTDEVLQAFYPNREQIRKTPRIPEIHGQWTEDDVILITYGNSIIDGHHKPLDLLQDFLVRYLEGSITGVHILPFFPFTSDEGFSVTDYTSVNPVLGDWPDINRIADKFLLMSDLVLNHMSSQGPWFSAFLQGQAPYDAYFVEGDPNADVSAVVRPRTSPLLRQVDTPTGVRHVWCTFSHDQVDLNFANPNVLLEFLRIMRLHIENGVRIIRLDAVAFLWKEIGTNCIHLPETHAIIQLMRALLDYNAEPVVLLTETNVPNKENLSYFGVRNEAHSVYNFSLPPLLAHSMLAGTSRYLNQWQMAMPPAPLGCAYLNFSASHDGIGMRPAEGLLPETEIELMLDRADAFGGRVSMRTAPDGGEKPYELNITFFDLMKGTKDGEDAYQFDRFMCSQTIVLALEGIPAIYIHALLATENDTEGVQKSGVNRAINRHRWNYSTLRALLEDDTTVHARSLSEINRRARIRRGQSAFHPNATQFTLQLGDELFGFWRQSLHRDQSIFAVHNLTSREVVLPSRSLNLIDGDSWTDLLSGDQVGAQRTEIVFAPYQCRWISNLGINSD